MDQITPKRSVPQGSALGPDLFNYSVIDIPIDDGSTHPSVFVDDIALWATGRTIEEVKDDLQSSL